MEKEKIVLKYGSEAVTDQHGMNDDFLAQSAMDIAGLEDRFSFVVVSSGAVAVGRRLWSQLHENSDQMEEPTLQAYAMAGSGPSFVSWQSAFWEKGILAGQLLVTDVEIKNPIERPVLKNALRDCEEAGILPVVNENDAMSIKELAKLAYNGDNDGVGGHISILIDADHYIIFTKKGGLLDENGEEVRRLTPDRYKWAKKLVKARKIERERIHPEKQEGRGGMSNKLKISKKFAKRGVKVYIAKSGEPIEAVLAGDTGTQIIAKAA